MKQDEAQAIDQFRDRLLLVYALKYGLAALAVWAFAYGTLVLALRAGFGADRLVVLWGLLTLPLALLPAAWLAFRRLPSPQAIRAVLDRHGRCGGLLMAGDERPLGEWQYEIPEVRQPNVHYRPGRSIGFLASGLAYLALPFLLPAGFANLNAGQLDVEREAEKLAKQLDVLEKEKLLEKQRATELKERLEKVRREARANDPVKTLESLDHLQELANKTARDAAEAAIRKMEKLGRTETLAEASDKLGGKMDEARLTELMKQLSALARKAAEENELLESGLDKATLEALKAGKLSPEQTKKLIEALKNSKDATLSKMGKLVKAQLIDADQLAKCDKAGKCDCAGLAAFLKENGCQSDLANEVALAEVPGKGGVDRGPGPAKLTFGDESTEEGVKFKEEELPQAKLQAIKDATLTGISVGTPSKNAEKPGASTAGALSGAKSGGGSASTQVVLPRHRGTVERYFDRPAK